MSPAVAVSQSAAGETPELPKPVKILLVDDQQDNLLSASAVLESLGEEVITAQSGREALLLLLDQDFAVIVLDIMMPEMDGFETATFIRQRERSRHTPIIFLTALGRSDEHIRRGYDLGAVDYITKPFVPEFLRAKVSVFVELHRKSQLLQQQSELLERRNAELQEAVKHSRQAEEQIKALNAHLEARLDQLNEANKELETFSYSVSHDLRGPLSRMSGFSRALLESSAANLDSQAKLYLKRIDDGARHTCDLVDDLLQFSRLARVEMSEAVVDLSAVVRGIAAELSAREPGRRVEFAIADGVTTRGDLALLRAALLNLFENAWKFTRKHPQALIEFGTLENTEGPVYFVRDDGAGFDMGDSARLFNPFQRLHKDSEFEGTGIGLATVERIVRRHGGRIWAEGGVERGATFYFTLHREDKL
ncbi:MAG TPA: response regulator [Bryobacteraceae bacterium]|nr:response regulator [Bryobacteraceae bacterium]